MNLLNVIANAFICVNATLFYIYVFGRENRRLKQLSWLTMLSLRVGLILIAVGGFYHVAILDYPIDSQTLFNVGLAFILTWASIFHYQTFIKPNKDG
jgi:hypothetical protein